MEKSNENLEVLIHHFDLMHSIEKIKNGDAWKSGRKDTLALLKQADMNIILIAMPKDSEIATHQANGRISVQVIVGVLKFSTDNESVLVKKGQLISLSKSIKHDLKALEDTFFLLTKINS